MQWQRRRQGARSKGPGLPGASEEGRVCMIYCGCYYYQLPHLFSCPLAISLIYIRRPSCCSFPHTQPPFHFLPSHSNRRCCLRDISCLPPARHARLTRFVGSAILLLLLLIDTLIHLARSALPLLPVVYYYCSRQGSTAPTASIPNNSCSLSTSSTQTQNSPT